MAYVQSAGICEIHDLYDPVDFSGGQIHLQLESGFPMPTAKCSSEAICLVLILNLF